jgi:hypothetical protein
VLLNEAVPYCPNRKLVLYNTGQNGPSFFSLGLSVMKSLAEVDLYFTISIYVNVWFYDIF